MIFLFHLGTAIGGVIVAALLAWKLLAFHEQYSFVERVGMGLVGGTLILRIAPVMASPDPTPFSDWSTFLMTVGLGMVHGGRLLRLRHHAAKNEVAADAARQYLKDRGRV